MWHFGLCLAIGSVRESCSLEHLVYGSVVPPRSTSTLNLRTHNIEKASSWKEEYLLQSRIMRNVIDFKDLGGQAHEVTMGADYVLERQKLLKVNYFFIDNFF
jgi:hypothetical protein